MKVAILICDAGDGSAYLDWFKNVELAKSISNKHEDYYMNEGSPNIIEVPDGWSPPSGFSDDMFSDNGEEE